ncbi:lytic transglycosylase domain-containing protein [Bradyrhizobium sp. USDA 10063]
MMDAGLAPLACHFSVPPVAVPARSSKIGASRGNPKRSQGAVSLMAAWMVVRGTMSISLGLLLMLGLTSIGRAQPALCAQNSLPSDLLQVVTYAAFITESSHRFAIPEGWIRAVIQIESGWNKQAMSPKGALGLMQIMPQTWVELSVRYDLGIDPFDARDNITAGTAYLREMLDRFGSEGFLAAYNAGPTRYEEHLTTGRPLPAETQTYVARLAPLIGIEQHGRGTSATRHVLPWQQAPIFVKCSDGSPPNGNSASGVRSMDSSNGVPKAFAPALTPRATKLFLQRSDEVQSR